MEWQHKTITSALGEVAAAMPHAVALVQGDQRVTYEELVSRAARIATGMSRLGVHGGEHVAVLYPSSIIVQILQFANACLGTVHVPLNIMLSPDDLSYILGHADVTTLFVGGSYRDTPLTQVVLNTIDELRTSQATPLQLEKFPKLRRIILLDEEGADDVGFPRLSEVERRGEKDTFQFVNAASKPEDISHLLYTSGSTAFPKGVLLTHRGVTGAAFWWGEALALTSHDRSLALMPYYHTGGLFISSMCVLFRGGYVCMFSDGVFDAGEALEIIQRERVTMAAGFDPQVQAILEHPQRGQYDLSSLQKLLNFSGAAYDRRAAAGISLMVGFYALTEGSNPVCAVMPGEKRHHIRRDSCGPSLPGVDVKIIDPDTKKTLPPNKIGELCFRGWNRFAGYYKPSEKNMPEKIFDKDGFFSSGDYGYLDEDRNFYFLGRGDDLIKTGGENVSPLEVENFLMKEFPGIIVAQVVGVADAKWGQIVTAFIETKPGVHYTSEDVIAKCRAHLSAFKVPKDVYFVQTGEWPTTSTAKIRKSDLRQIALKASGQQ